VEAQRALRRRYGERLVRLVLFGSQARGEARSQSDVDVLVVLHDDFNVYQEARRLVDIELALFDRYGINVHLLAFSAARYGDTGHPLMKNVHEEGVEL
jgi:hypothetical protein